MTCRLLEKLQTVQVKGEGFFFFLFLSFVHIKVCLQVLRITTACAKKVDMNIPANITLWKGDFMGYWQMAEPQCHRSYVAHPTD